MDGGFHLPTDIRWMEWHRVGDLLPKHRLRIDVLVGNSSLPRAIELKNRHLARHEVTVHLPIPADPTTGSAQAVLDSLRHQPPDWVIAMGGGSVLDTAKAAALLTNHEGTVAEYLRGERELPAEGIPVVAVPTTAGSGSEVTPYASITDTALGKKVSLTHDSLFPKFAVMDASLTLSLPPGNTAVSGMDALAHAIEAYWSKASTGVTDGHALRSAKLALGSLGAAYEDGMDATARRSMLHGSLLAGMAISHAKTTAVHAASYPMTVLFHVPHGLACSLLLPSFVRYNAGAMEPVKEQALTVGLGVTSMADLSEAIEELRERLQMPKRLRDVGLVQKDIATIVEHGFRPDRVGNNPRDVTSESLTELLEGVL